MLRSHAVRGRTGTSLLGLFPSLLVPPPSCWSLSCAGLAPRGLLGKALSLVLPPFHEGKTPDLARRLT